MRGLPRDICIEAQVRILITVLNGPDWREIWQALNLPLYTFRELQLAPATPDSVIWELCQREQLVLITANRNQEGSTSLEATIQAHNTPDCLPVLTVGDAEDIHHSRTYAERAARSLIEYLFDIDKYRGTGRLYLP